MASFWGLTGQWGCWENQVAEEHALGAQPISQASRWTRTRVSRRLLPHPEPTPRPRHPGGSAHSLSCQQQRELHQLWVLTRPGASNQSPALLLEAQSPSSTQEGLGAHT